MLYLFIVITIIQEHFYVVMWFSELMYFQWIETNNFQMTIPKLRIIGSFLYFILLTVFFKIIKEIWLKLFLLKLILGYMLDNLIRSIILLLSQSLQGLYKFLVYYKK